MKNLTIPIILTFCTFGSGICQSEHETMEYSLQYAERFDMLELLPLGYNYGKPGLISIAGRRHRGILADSEILDLRERPGRSSFGEEHTVYPRHHQNYSNSYSVSYKTVNRNSFKYHAAQTILSAARSSFGHQEKGAYDLYQPEQDNGQY